MEAVVAMKIDSFPRATVTTDARTEKKSRLELNPQEGTKMRIRESLNLLEPPVGQFTEDKRIAACYRMHQEIAENKIEDSTMTAATEFVVSSFTLAVMAMRTISKHLKSARVFAMMLSVFVIWHLCMDGVLRILRGGTSMLTVKHVKSSNSADVTGTKTTSRINDLVKTLVNMMHEHQKLNMFQLLRHEL